MDRTKQLLCAAMALAGCAGDAGEPGPGSDAGRSIVIYYDNDVHCAIDGYAPMHHLARQTADTAWVATVSAGDFTAGGAYGTLSHGHDPLKLVHAMQYDAITPGNHEFEYGSVEALENAVGLNVVCCNFVDKEEGRTVFPPGLIKAYGSRRVAFVGVTTTHCNDYLYSERYEVTSPACVQAAVYDARARGADYVIVISHLGVEKKSEDFVTSRDLIAMCRGIDAVIDGHSHTVLPCEMVQDRDGRPVPLTQTGTQFAHLGKMVIGRNGGITAGLIAMDSLPAAPPSDPVEALTDSIKAAFSAGMARELGVLPFPLEVRSGDRYTVRLEECGVGNLVADAFRHDTGADIALMNAGSISASTPAGIFTVRQACDILPGEDVLVVQRVSGRQILDYLNHCYALWPEPFGMFAQVSGLRFVIDTTDGNAVKEVMALGADGIYHPLEEGKAYTVATTSFLLTTKQAQPLAAGTTVHRGKELICKLPITAALTWVFVVATFAACLVLVKATG